MKTLLLIAFVPLLWGQDMAGVGSVTGVVTGGEGRPAANVRVCVATTTRCAVTGKEGGFRLTEIRAGEYRLAVSAPGVPEILSGTLSVRAGLEDQVQVQLPKMDEARQSVTVSEPVFVAPEEVKTSSFLVERHEVFKSSVAQADVSRYVQSLPGVGVGRNDGRNDLIVRGGSPLENLFVVDNVEIPNINTFANFASAGGLTSILDPDLIRDVNFMTGGYPAPFANRTSSVLQIAAREGSREEFGARLSMSTLTAGAILEGPLGRSKKGSWVTSAKRSYFESFRDSFDNNGDVPVIYTFNTKVLYDLTSRDRIWLVNFSGIDSIRISPTDPAKNDPDGERIAVSYKGWRSSTGLNWQHLYGERGVGLFGISHSEAHVNQSVKDVGRYGLPEAETPLLYREDSAEGESTVKYDLTTYMAGLAKVQAGGSFKAFRIRYDTAQPFGADNPFSAVRDLNPFSLRRSLLAYQSGAYLQSSRNLTQRLNLTWGGRFDDYQRLGRSRFSPRAGVSYRVNEKLSLRASFGLFHQQPLFLLQETFAQNRGLIPIRAVHRVAGLMYIFGPTVRMTVEAYQKDYRDYPVSVQFPSFSLASAGDTFDVSEILMPYVSAGRGRSRGVEFFVEKKFRGRWFGQANVSISETKYSGLDQIRRSGTYDYPVVVNGVVGYKLTRKWDVSSSFRYMSGRPYTPFDAVQSQRQNRGIYDLSRVNGLRTPAYFRPDFRFDRTFTVRERPLLFWMGVQNIGGRKNYSGVTWNENTNREERERQQGAFPLIGVDWKF